MLCSMRAVTNTDCNDQAHISPSYLPGYAGCVQTQLAFLWLVLYTVCASCLKWLFLCHRYAARHLRVAGLLRLSTDRQTDRQRDTHRERERERERESPCESVVMCVNTMWTSRLHWFIQCITALSAFVWSLNCCRSLSVYLCDDVDTVQYGYKMATVSRRQTSPPTPTQAGL